MLTTTTTCIAPLTDGATLCGAPSTTTRIVEDLVVALCAEHAAELDAERAARRLDLWEDNAGGLCLVDRAAGKGWRGFESGQNLRAHRVTPRTEFTLASDAPDFDNLGDGSAYEAMSEADVEALYEHASDHRDAPVMVASWERGAVTVHPGSIGAAARWYLAIDGDN